MNNMINNFIKFFSTSVIILFLIAIPKISFAQGLASHVVQGHVDEIYLDDSKLVAQGWACSTEPDSRIAEISIKLGDALVYQGGFESFDRPDVAASPGLEGCAGSGWKIDAGLSKKLNFGEYAVTVRALNSSNEVRELGIANGFKSLTLGIKTKNMGIKIGLCLMLLVGCFVFFKAEKLAESLQFGSQAAAKPAMVFGAYLLVCFTVLLILGVTGSSFRVGLQQTPFLTADSKNIFGKDQPIRSDEWRVLTPLAIAQYNHSPQFPVHNKNLGADGQNMMVVGMAGTPVAHISAIAKPATWGFFLFDLKRALSWYWIFPVFACLLAVWGLVALLVPGQWRASFLVALSFSFSPYLAAWSNWPAYTVFFPCITLLTLVAIFKEQRKFFLIGLAGVLGISLAGFFLILYPPWQISLAYAFTAVTIGVFVRDGLYKNFNKWVLASIAVSLVVAGGILWFWWVDANSAIRAMMDTVYPGQRKTLTGGGYGLSSLLRGFTNFVTLRRLDSTVSNQSEIASFFYMLLPLLYLFIVRGYQKLLGAVEVALFVIIVGIIYFMAVGVSPTIANFTLWGRVTPERADLALGLCCILLSGVLLLPARKPLAGRRALKIGAAAVSVIWVGVIGVGVSSLHPSLVQNFSRELIVFLAIVLTLSGYFLAVGNFRGFIAITLILSAGTVLKFNPVNVAPHAVEIDSIASQILREKSGSTVAGKRILVLETQLPAMLLLANGREVVNGVFYYPQKSLWQRLDKDAVDHDIYNRYQHLIFSGGAVDNQSGARIETPFLDIVKVVVDLEKFDFRKTDAGILVSPENNENALKKNPTLTYKKSDKGWSWFSVNPE